MSQIMPQPSEEHIDVVMINLCYLRLKSSLEEGLMFTKHGHLEIDGYTHKRVGNVIDWRSGYFTFVGGNLVNWRIEKQGYSSIVKYAEVEVRGITHDIRELLWLKRIMMEIGFAPTSEMKKMFTLWFILKELEDEQISKSR